MGKNIVIAPYDFFSKIWTTKWYNYIKHLVDDYGWILIDISNKSLHKPKMSLKSTLEKCLQVENIDGVDNVLYWHQNYYFHFSELFLNDVEDKIKISLYYDDVHYKMAIKIDESKKYAHRVFSSCPVEAVKAYLPGIEDKYIFAPHGATEEFRVLFNKQPVNQICLSGNISPHGYPLRYKMLKLSRTKFKNSIFHLKHPGYGFQRKLGSYVGSQYANVLNRYIAGLGDSGLHKYEGKHIYYILSKMFEIPASGSLLMANEEVRDELEKLGFKNMVNYLEFNTENMEDKILFILDKNNREVVDKIREGGQKLVHAKHMAKDRAGLIDSCLK